MKLRYYAAFVTWVLAALLMAASMWVWTQKDVLEIYIVTVMFSPIFPLAVLAFTEPEEPDREEQKKRHFKIYTLTEENGYDRKVG